MKEGKIWKTDLSSKAFFSINPQAAYMVGSSTTFIKVNENGTTIYGPVSTVAGTESCKSGGMFTQLPNLIKMIPSTTFSPIPDQIPSPPLNIFFDLAEDVSYFAMMLG